MSQNTSRFLRLSFWCAEPLTREQARTLLERAEQRTQAYLRRGRSCLTCDLQHLIARFWLGEPTADHFDVLRARLKQSRARARALVELAEGQLLMSHRLEGALERLQRGFAIAEPLLSPGDYFTVLNRHRQLALLPLSATPMPGEGLEGLLATAGVIEKMGGAGKPPIKSDPSDLYG